jgi:MFS family permease
LLAILTVILAFNYMDRFALGMILQDVKTDLHLTDTELGLLSGIAFAVFYSVMGIPIARYADRGNRVLIIVASTAMWSTAVMGCGFVASYWQLNAVRVAVGVGEAGCVPPALSLIADLFGRTERARAVSVYMQGISASLVLGYFVSGWLDQLYGWRAMFVLIGAPGVLLSIVAQVWLREPRKAVHAAPHDTSNQLPFTQVAKQLWSNRSFRHLLYANSILWFFSYGTMQWTPAFFLRSFGSHTGELGTWFAVLYGVSGFLGTYWGGELAARYGRKNEPWQLRGMALLAVACGVFMGFVYIPALSVNAYAAFLWLGLSNLAGVMTNGPLFAVIQTLVPPSMRAIAVALVYLFANLIGMGLGPWAAGALSDVLGPWVGHESLRYAMLLLCPGFLWGAWHIWRSSFTVTHDLNQIVLHSQRQGPTDIEEYSAIGTFSPTNDGR